MYAIYGNIYLDPMGLEKKMKKLKLHPSIQLSRWAVELSPLLWIADSCGVDTLPMDRAIHDVKLIAASG